MLIPTSYIHWCHPCIGMIQKTVKSLERVGLQNAHVIICCDGEVGDPPAYQIYRDRIGVFNRRFEVLGSKEKLGLAWNLKRGIEKTKTELVFILEHDFEIVMDIPLERIERVFEEPAVKWLAFNQIANATNSWVIDLIPVVINGVEVCKTNAWGDGPHFARTSYYTNFILQKTKKTNSAFGLETVIHPWITNQIKNVGFEEAHREAGNFIYGKLGFPAVVRHFGGVRKRKGDGPRGRPSCCDKG